MSRRIPVSTVFQLVVVFLISGFFFFFGLGAFGLVGADEPRYAQIAREMFTRQDWIVPTLNGVPWLEKPVFLYWNIYKAYSLFGVSDWAARTPAAAHALVLMLASFFFMRRFRPGAEMFAAVITASSAAMIAFARAASTDILLSSHFAMAMLAWWAWRQSERKIWLALFYALLAFGALSKGPVAPGLAVLVVGAFALLLRDKNIFLRSLWWPGILIFCAIALPWYVAVQIKVHEFWRVFFLEHNLERFGTNLYQHSQPFWYYLPVFLLSTVPWTLFTVLAIVDAVKTEIRLLRAPAQADGKTDHLPLFLLVWTLVPVIFFSVSRSKLPGYILPAVPAAALLTADYIRFRLGRLSRWPAMLHSLLCGALVGAALLAPALMLKLHPGQTAQSAIWIGAGVTAILVLLLVRFGGTRLLPFSTLVPVVVVLAFLLRPAAPFVDAANSARAVDARLTQLTAAAGPIAVFEAKRNVEYGLNFYRNQPISRYERDGVPEPDHIVVAREGSMEAIRARVGSRQVSFLGDFPPQHLEFFWVSQKP